MPCDSGPCNYEEITVELDRATRAACEMGGLFKDHAQFNRLSKSTRKWYRQHKEWDAEREAEERAERKQDALRKKVLGKLSAKEREALGL